MQRKIFTFLRQNGDRTKIEISVDMQALAKVLGKKAILSGSNRATMASGAAVAVVLEYRI